MATLLTIVKAVLEIAGMALIAQLAIGVFAWNRRHQNAVYKLFEVVTSPFTRLTRLVTPKFVLDRHIPLATFFLLFVLWLAVLFELAGSCRADPQQRARALPYNNKANDGMTAIARLIARIRLRCVAYATVLFKRTPEAIGVYRQLIALAPRDVVARAALGNLYAESDDLTAAVREFEQLVEIDPLAADAWFNLGFLHDKREELGAAERCFRKAVELKPSLDRAWYGLGLVLIRDGRLDEAIQAFTRNIKLQPFSPYGYYQLGMTYHHLGRSSDAWKVYEKLAEFEPKFSATLKRDLQRTAPRAVTRQSDEDSVSKEVTTVEAV